jgi:hypothetical protein
MQRSKLSIPRVLQHLPTAKGSLANLLAQTSHFGDRSSPHGVADEGGDSALLFILATQSDKAVCRTTVITSLSNHRSIARRCREGSADATALNHHPHFSAVHRSLAFTGKSVDGLGFPAAAAKGECPSTCFRET